ncbi:aminotransferase class V-fold PLP-dependent enzyme [Diaminobutyricibacter tongyongensis]|uniref:Aminotransferase class V-fold PLP-dependent enzyme n=1 Tax=Leifsonia tongyongensis TaxID=1268043 RepID=A0A6L9XZD0_9MICO|nr:aminotransferase class V-fold PLP-dependent enzyme [Diaminobutyricibacter tongyongensis]NEN06750.1 aminotransferase class V-fold PLP-dependent enzyme [Diaminobutyricibacter tongyongensis]
MPTRTPDRITDRISDRITIEEARTHFAAGPRYLAACTQGLPLRETLEASRADLDTWERGHTHAADYDIPVASARASFAELVNVEPSRVAIGSQVSALASVVAAAAPDGAEIVCVDGDFSSIVFPFLVQAHRGVSVRHVPLARLAEEIGPRTWLVAFSLVQSATGEIADAQAVARAARANDAFTLCDVTQAAGWLPVDAGEFDVTVCSAYKWLCSPRGSAFMVVTERIQPVLRPIQAGWYAGDDPWKSCYGPDMPLATDARQFDVSPAWPVWPGTAAALDVFRRLDLDAVQAHASGLGDALCARLDLEAKGQAIVTWHDVDGRDLAALTAAGIRASGRAGRARVAFHLWNTPDDVDAVVSALRR